MTTIDSVTPQTGEDREAGLCSQHAKLFQFRDQKVGKL